MNNHFIELTSKELVEISTGKLKASDSIFEQAEGLGVVVEGIACISLLFYVNKIIDKHENN